MSKFRISTIDVISVAEDAHGLCAKAHIQIRGASTLIRWGLDEFTYHNLDACLKPHVGQSPVLHSREASNTNRVGWLRLTSVRPPLAAEWDGNEQHFSIQGFFLDDLQEASLLCSTVFASNLIWLYEIKSIQDLNGIGWEALPEGSVAESIEASSTVETSSTIEVALEDSAPQPVEFNGTRDVPDISDTDDRQPLVPADVMNDAGPAELESSVDDAAPTDVTDNRDHVVSDRRHTYWKSAPVLRRGKRSRMGPYAVSAVAVLIILTAGYTWLRQKTGENTISNVAQSRAAESNTLYTSNVSNGIVNKAGSVNLPRRGVQTNHPAAQNAVGYAPAPTPQHRISTGQNTSTNKSDAGSGQQQGASQGVQVYRGTKSVRVAHEVSEVPQGDVALTFDDGPTPMTSDFVKLLTKYGIHATFFFVGQQVKYWPNSVKLAAASEEVIGDHSMTHPDLTGLTEEQQESQILDDRALLERLTNQRVLLFRPPYGAYNNATGDILASNGMALTLWNRDPRDWAAKTPDQVVQAVLDSNPSGGLYDLHEDKATLAALPQIIQGLKAMHLKFVTLPAPILASKTTSGGA